jgi:hydrogenase maturation protease
VSTLVLGLGNEFRGDDAAGLVVARLVRGHVSAGVVVGEVTGDATRLIDLWAGAERVILVDAMRSGRTPGTVLRLDLLASPPEGASESREGLRSSHAIGVLEAVALSRRLGSLPHALVAYGIEGADFSLGGLLSPQVSAAVREVTASILTELGRR